MCDSNDECASCMYVDICDEILESLLPDEQDEDIEPEQCDVNPPTYGGIAW